MPDLNEDRIYTKQHCCHSKCEMHASLNYDVTILTKAKAISRKPDVAGY